MKQVCDYAILFRFRKSGWALLSEHRKWVIEHGAW